MKWLHINRDAQSIVEFAFSMIVVVFLIYGMVRLFLWTGMDLANRSWVQDNTLMTIRNDTLFNVTQTSCGCPTSAGSPCPPACTLTQTVQELGIDPANQLSPDFYRQQPIDAVYNGSITNGE